VDIHSLMLGVVRLHVSGDAGMHVSMKLRTGLPRVCYLHA